MIKTHSANKVLLNYSLFSITNAPWEGAGKNITKNVSFYVKIVPKPRILITEICEMMISDGHDGRGT